MLKQHYHAQEQKRLTSSKSCLLSISVHKKFTGIQSKYIEGLGKKKRVPPSKKREIKNHSATLKLSCGKNMCLTRHNEIISMVEQNNSTTHITLKPK